MRHSRPSRVQVSARFQRSLEKLRDTRLRESAKQALLELVRDANNPSLKLEPVQGRTGFWTIRVNRNFRILLQQVSDAEGKLFIAYDVSNHDIYR